MLKPPSPTPHIKASQPNRKPPSPTPHIKASQPNRKPTSPTPHIKASQPNRKPTSLAQIQTKPVRNVSAPLAWSTKVKRFFKVIGCQRARFRFRFINNMYMA